MKSEVVPCDRDAIDHATPIFFLDTARTTADNKPAASMDLYIETKRCATPEAHLNEVLAETIETRLVRDPSADTVAGHPGLCANLSRLIGGREQLVKICVFEVDSALFQLYQFTDVELQNSVQPALDQALASLRFYPLSPNDVSITTLDNKFDTPHIVIPAGVPVTLRITNSGVAIHNIHVGRADGQFSGDFCGDPETEPDPCSSPSRILSSGDGALALPAFDAGTRLQFRCDYHPSEMNGTITVQ